ncbi:transglutaminase family protein, partial [Acinetobacter baumannii]
MARVFDQGLTTPKGYVLPIQRWNPLDSRHPGRWRSEKWKLRRGNLFLFPGDSPLGLRLPISSLEHVPPDDYPYVV